jgi:hypothetical protein
MDTVPGFIKITKNLGFNHLETPVGNIENWVQQYEYGPIDQEFCLKKIVESRNIFKTKWGYD